MKGYKVSQVCLFIIVLIPQALNTQFVYSEILRRYLSFRFITKHDKSGNNVRKEVKNWFSILRISRINIFESTIKYK